MFKCDTVTAQSAFLLDCCGPAGPRIVNFQGMQMQAEMLLTPKIDAMRVELRQWRAEDFPAYAAYYADPETAQYVGGVKDAQAAWRHLASLIGHWALRDFGVWAVEDKETGRLIGCVGFWMPENWPQLEMPFWFLSDAYESGLAAEALRAALDYGRRRFADIEFETYIPIGAEAANALAARAGGRRDGVIDLFDFGEHAVFKWR